jgi:5'-deoxynucleotidase YfbR-like HD superfamily hydrolase
MGVEVLTQKEVTAGLRSKPRRGYEMRGIPLPLCETVHEHERRSGYSFQLAAPHFGITGEALKHGALMLYTHDHPEYLLPDWTPYCAEKPSPQEKHRQEHEAMRIIAPAFGKHASRILDAFDEFQENATMRARLGNQIEKGLFGIVGLHYRQLGYELDSPPLYDEIRTKIHEPLLLAIYDRMLALYRHNGRQGDVIKHYNAMLKAGKPL